MSDRKLRVGVIMTIYRPRAHADVIVSRWLEPRAADADWGWSTPRSRIASMYVAQFPENDMARAMAEKHGVPLHDTVDGALRQGGRDLAVDAVLLIGEHGEYPYNEIGQHLYPRKELFDQIVASFDAAGRCVPVFCDKHLSWNFDWARQMMDTARHMGFPLLSASSIPHCRREPKIKLPYGTRIDEAVEIFYSGDEAYGYHGVEYGQAMAERRAGGETGVKAVTVWRGEDVWKQLDAGAWPKELMEAALAAADGPPSDSEYGRPQLTPGDYRANCRDQTYGPTAIRVDYLDGFRMTHLNMSGHIKGWTIAMHINGRKQILATAAMVGDADLHFPHFATLSRLAEDMFLTGKPPFPPQRGLLTTGITEALMQARAKPGVPLATPQLAIQYDPADYPGFTLNPHEL